VVSALFIPIFLHNQRASPVVLFNAAFHTTEAPT
jgi:hypothetical protein